MTVGELIAELEHSPRGATVRAVVIDHGIVAGAADVERVDLAGTKSRAEWVPKDVVIVACVNTVAAKQPIAPRWDPIMSRHV